MNNFSINTKYQKANWVFNFIENKVRYILKNFHRFLQKFYLFQQFFSF